MLELPTQRSRPDPDLAAALSLSAITRDPFAFRVEPSRDGRAELRGVTRDVVDAFARIFGAELDTFGSDPLSRVLSPSRSDVPETHFEVDIDPPGSVVELLGVLLPGLLRRDYPTELVLRGCTHVPGAYLPEQVEPALVPLVEAMGGGLEIELDTYGFPPRGPGQLRATVSPIQGRVQPLDLRDRGYVRHVELSVFLAHLPRDIGLREIDAFAETMDADVSLGATLTELHDAASQGNALLIDVEGSECPETLAVMGEKGVPAEEIGRRGLSEFATYLAGRGQLRDTTRWALTLAVMAGEGRIWSSQFGAFSRAICEFAPRLADTHVVIEGEESETVKFRVTR
jgi:RNA 3'-terminal phosphate cyclase (ATP)